MGEWRRAWPAAARADPAFPSDRPDYPDTFSTELKALLNSLLNKQASARPTLRQLWDDPWVTRNGAEPLHPPYEDNCQEIFEPSKTEIDESMRALRGSMFLAAKAASKFKGLLSKRRSMSGGGLTTDAPRSASPEREIVQSPRSESPSERRASPSPNRQGSLSRGASPARRAESPLRGMTRMEELKLHEGEQ